MTTPEQTARVGIDGGLGQAGWVVQDYAGVNLAAGRGVWTLRRGAGGGSARDQHRAGLATASASRCGGGMDPVQQAGAEYQHRQPRGHALGCAGTGGARGMRRNGHVGEAPGWAVPAGPMPAF